MGSNSYEELLAEWQRKFRDSGQEILQKHGKYPIGTDMDVAVTFCNRTCTLSLKDGIVYGLQPMMQMMFYSHLESVQQGAFQSNTMEPLGTVPR